MALEIWFVEDIRATIRAAEVALPEGASQEYRRGWEKCLRVIRAAFGLDNAAAEVTQAGFTTWAGGNE